MITGRTSTFLNQGFHDSRNVKLSYLLQYSKGSINCPVRQTNAAVESPWHCGLLKLFRDQSMPHLQTSAVGCYITSFISQPDEDVFPEDFAQVALSSEKFYY